MSAEGSAYPPPPVGGSPSDWSAWANALPSSRELELVCKEIVAGRATLVMASSPWAANPNGSVHGGLVAAAADQCMGIVAVTSLPAGLLPATATLHTEFRSPAFAPLTFRARVTRSGRTLLFVEVEVEDREGRCCTRCTGTMSVDGSSRHRP